MHFTDQESYMQVPKDDRYIMEVDGLLIKNVQVTDDGIYTCRAFVMDTGDLQRREIKVEVNINDFDMIHLFTYNYTFGHGILVYIHYL